MCMEKTVMVIMQELFTWKVEMSGGRERERDKVQTPAMSRRALATRDTPSSQLLAQLGLYVMAASRYERAQGNGAACTYIVLCSK